MGSTFVRFQEFYESPEFKGKYFSLNQFQEWYMKSTNKDNFTYYDDWYGFNIPSEVLIPFYEGHFDPLTENEQNLLNYFKGKTGKFYIIGCMNDEKIEDNLKHEIAHALYYANSDYKKESDAVLASIEPDIIKLFKDQFDKSAGYHPDVFKDEVQAYLTAIVDSIMVERVLQFTNSKQKKLIYQYSDELNKIFDKYK